MAWMTAVATALSCIVYPSVYIITAAYLLLQLLVKVLVKVLGTVLVTPLLYLGNSILSLILLPLRILAKFESILIYLGVAIVMGIGAGFIVYYSSSTVVNLLGHAMGALWTPSAPPTGPSDSKALPGHQVRQAGLVNAPLFLPRDQWRRRDGKKAPRGTRQAGLQASTILEEDSSEYSDEELG
ncbi:uncharacterized protein BDW47DRAFT_91226 [Aspergillus candidus]|uniref:Uncharacterized protein n=1 Tax=Aspergillus candidus TaxID=41067 RepID=A0A2I2EYV9_ASPCN|nr:hypothetical protein BDW47DRAFT_91226 [Aspergillus candidus]PLB33567.1 hypothetical protein BDW47DRAFT_91226 [Aspergillus candidus]